IPDQPAEPILQFTTVGMVQGYVEQSNVNPVLEMTHLIAVSRAFEGLTAAVDNTDRTMQNAIRTLGETS
ncbi:MAG: flagellar basal body rod C-terminal domain-containing protein, partial [Aestuariivirgaceae bacterium]